MCLQCPLGKVALTKHRNRRSIYREYQVKDSLDVLFVGDIPSDEDIATRSPVSGRYGLITEQYVREVMDPSIGVAFTLSVLCPTSPDPSSKNLPAKKGQLTACRSNLARLIKTIKPKAICPLGAIAKATVQKLPEELTQSGDIVFPLPSPGILLQKQEAGLIELTRFKRTLLKVSNHILELR
jgi:uracil-DNA glycosylase